MRLLTCSIALMLFAVFLTACSISGTNVATQQPKPVALGTPYPDGARRVTIEELETLIKEGRAFVVDVRTQDSYDAGHIPGSKVIPTAEIVDRMKELPRDKTIVTYCS